jgi:hypothetical protein
MRCAILNRNYPPNSGITGCSAYELAAYLNEHGVEVHIVTAGGNYQGGVHTEKSNQSVTIHHVRKVYDGKNKILRLVGSLIEGRNMAIKATSLGITPVITLTDPPLLNYWVARACRRRRIPWIYWSMDHYPEAFAAAGLAKTNGFLYRRFKEALLQSTPAHLIALGPQQGAYIQKDYALPVPMSILPCGVDQIDKPVKPPNWLPPGMKIIFGYIGNLGQAHDPAFVETVIAALDPDKHHFILSVYGIHAARVLKHAAKFKHVTILPELQRNELSFIDVHLASLEPAWDHVCVPSKSVSAVCAGGSLLLCASDQGDNWQLLKEAAWRVTPGADMPAAVTRILNSLTPAAVADKRQNAGTLYQTLLQMRTVAFAEIIDAVRRLQTSF